jgi:hypothetical protein
VKKVVEVLRGQIAEIKDGIEASNKELRELRQVRPDLFRKEKGGKR